MIQKLNNIQFNFQHWYYYKRKYFKIGTEIPEEKLKNIKNAVSIPLMINKGKFSGVIYCYKCLRYNEDGMTYSHQILMDFDDLTNKYKNEFINLTRKILWHILWEMIHGSKEYNVSLLPDFNYENRIIDPKEPNERRVLRKKNSSIFEE